MSAVKMHRLVAFLRGFHPESEISFALATQIFGNPAEDPLVFDLENALKAKVPPGPCALKIVMTLERPPKPESED